MLGFEDVLDERFAVIGVIDGEVGGKADMAIFPAQNASKDAMEGAHSDTHGRLCSHHGGYALLHLHGSFVGEGKCHDILWPNAHDIHQIGNLGGQNSCFATACSRYHE